MAYQVKFDTGQTVNFDSPPTQQDIDEVSQKLGVSKPQFNGEYLQGAGVKPSLSALKSNIKALPGQIGDAAVSSLPILGSVGGALAGGAGGLAVGGPIGAYAGGVLGSGVGAGIGTAAQNAIRGNNIGQNVGGNALGYGAADAIGGPLLSAGSKAAGLITQNVSKTLAEKAGTVLPGVATKLDEQATKDSANAVKNAIDAVNPNLKGKTALQGYTGIVTGKTALEPRGMLSPQAVAPSKDITELGTRLADVLKSKDPAQNLVSLGKNLLETEGRLYSALSGSPEMQFNAQKATLMKSLEDSRTAIPEEYKAIGSEGQKAQFNSAITYAQRLLQKADDSIMGLRDARVAFDAQAKHQFPSAYKDGFIDMKSPAGRAIKLVRDAINDHLYETAPNGSAIKTLIKREADIFRAADYIAPKAIELHGKTTTETWLKYFKEHPVASSLGAAAAIGTALYAGPKAVQAATGQ